MKRNLVIFTLLFALMSTLSTYAVEDVIILDSATPSIDAVIALPLDTTGGVDVELAGASLTLYNDAGDIVLQVADARVHRVQFNLMANTGDHTLRLERLTNVDTALVQVTSIAEFLLEPTSQQVNNNTISVDQSTDVLLDSANPNTTLDIVIPSGMLGSFTTIVPNAQTMSQFTDVNNTVMATSMTGHINGLSILVDEGNYQYTVLDTDVSDETIANVRLTSYDISQTPILNVPQTDNNTTTDTTVVENTASTQNIACNASILVSSVNLRSGPGTGYSVIDYGFQTEVYPVGGINAQDNWIVVGLNDSQSAWMTKGAVNLNGSCDNLTVFNVPYREAQPAEVIIVPSAPIILQPSAVVAQSQPQETYQEEYEEEEGNNRKNYDDDSEDDDHDEDSDDD